MNDDIAKIYAKDDVLSMHLVQGLEMVGVAIANAKSPEVFKILKHILTSTQKDLTHYKIVHKSVKCTIPNKSELVEYAMKMFPGKTKTYFTKMSKDQLQTLIGGE